MTEALLALVALRLAPRSTCFGVGLVRAPSLGLHCTHIWTHTSPEPAASLSVLAPPEGGCCLLLLTSTEAPQLGVLLSAGGTARFGCCAPLLGQVTGVQHSTTAEAGWGARPVTATGLATSH